MSSTPNADTSHEQPSFTDALSGTTFARSFSLDDLEQPDTAAALSQDSINIQHSSEISDIKAMMLSMHSMLININDTNAMAASSTRLHVSDPSKAAANAISAPPASSSDMLLKRLTLDSAHEKDATRKYSLSSMDSAPLQAFLAAFKSYAEHVESSRPVLDFISFSVHGILKKRLGLPADTNLKSYFGVALGTDQPLLQALRTLAFPAKTSDKFKVLKDIHMMQPCSIFSPSDIESLFLQMKDFIGSNPLIFGTDIACLYPTMVECIQPVHFRTILKKYSSSYTNSSMSFSEFCTNVIDYHLNRYDSLIKLTADYGPLPMLPSTSVLPVPVKPSPPAAPKSLRCFNCHGDHAVKDCSEVCLHCKEQVRLKVLLQPCGLPPGKCYHVRTNKPRSAHLVTANAATATCDSDVSTTPALTSQSDTVVRQVIAVPPAITLSSLSSVDSLSHPISSDIFFDTGANRLFIHSKDLCCSIDDRPLLGSVSLPDGKRLPVTSSCTVKSASGLYCPTFDKTLAPAPLLTSNNLAVLVDTELIVVPLSAIVNTIVDDVPRGLGGLDIVTTVDSSFASDKTLKSYTGSTIAFGPSSGAVCAPSYTQKLTPASSMASEGIGVHLHVRKLLPIRSFVAELGFPQDKPTKVCMDNLPFMQTITGSRGCSDRSKWILLRHRVVQEAYARDEIYFEHLGTQHMVADILTKSLSAIPFHALRQVLLGRCNIHFTSQVSPS